EVIAIHHAGAGGWFNGRGYENYAVPMHKIVAKINSKFAGVLTGGQTPAPTPAPPVAKNPVIEKGLLYGAKVTANASVKATLKQASYGRVQIRVDLAEDAGDLDLYVTDANGKTVAKSISTTKVEQV